MSAQPIRNTGHSILAKHLPGRRICEEGSSIERAPAREGRARSREILEMRRLELFVLAGLVFAGMTRAQTTATTQTTASSSTQVRGAGQTGVQAQSSSSGSRSQSAQSSSRKGKGGGASTAANASASSSNSASASAGPRAVQLNDGTTVNAVLVNSLDARKWKPGDKIEARTSEVKQDGRVA